MATMKHYFDYDIVCGCALPRVTLEGTREDWADIYQRIEKLKEYGPQSIAWYHVLKPVLGRFVKAFDDPEGKENKKFWTHVAHWKGGSGPTYLSGWVTAFCAWDVDGKWMGFPFKAGVLDKDQTSTPRGMADLSARAFGKRYLEIKAPSTFQGLVTLYELDGATFPPVSGPPAAYAEVDVHLVDNGEEFDCAMVAGSVGMHVEAFNSKEMNGLRAASGWWMFVKKSEDAPPEKAQTVERTSTTKPATFNDRRRFWNAFSSKR
jgi:hypothetical protein